MSCRVDFHFDVVCPYAYLAHTQIEALCQRVAAELRWRPLLLGGVFQSIGAGNGPLAGMAAAKAAMNLRDMYRWAEHWGVPLSMPSGHPNRTVLAMRAIVAADDVARAAKALFVRYWRDGLDVSDPEVVRDALDAAGLPGEQLVSAADTPACKQALRDASDDAVRAGIFGVPSFVVHRDGREPELIWGQDRLHFVEKACT